MIGIVIVKATNKFTIYKYTYFKRKVRSVSLGNTIESAGESYPAIDL